MIFNSGEADAPVISEEVLKNRFPKATESVKSTVEIKLPEIMTEQEFLADNVQRKKDQAKDYIEMNLPAFSDSEVPMSEWASKRLENGRGNLSEIENKVINGSATVEEANQVSEVYRAKANLLRAFGSEFLGNNVEEVQGVKKEVVESWGFEQTKKWLEEKKTTLQGEELSKFMSFVENKSVDSNLTEIVYKDYEDYLRVHNNSSNVERIVTNPDGSHWVVQSSRRQASETTEQHDLSILSVNKSTGSFETDEGVAYLSVSQNAEQSEDNEPANDVVANTSEGEPLTNEENKLKDILFTKEMLALAGPALFMVIEYVKFLKEKEGGKEAVTKQARLGVDGVLMATLIGLRTTKPELYKKVADSLDTAWPILVKYLAPEATEEEVKKTKDGLPMGMLNEREEGKSDFENKTTDSMLSKAEWELATQLRLDGVSTFEFKKIIATSGKEAFESWKTVAIKKTNELKAYIERKGGKKK